MAAEAPIQLEVDGQVFEVQARLDLPGQYDFTWLSGPNPGYGFSSRSSDGSPLSTSDFEQSIRSFLARVDLVTGYLE